MAKDRIRHSRSDTPSYQFIVYERPRTNQHRKRKGSVKYYKDAIKREAKNHIASPITADDIEIDICYATRRSKGVRADIDNIIKPTLNALEGIAYEDDKQIRTVISSFFDLTKNHILDGYIEDMGPLLYSPQNDAVQISIYSNTRLKELGGAEVVRRQRSEEITKSPHRDERK